MLFSKKTTAEKIVKQYKKLGDKEVCQDPDYKGGE